MPVEPARLRPLNDLPLRAAGRYVLYWSQVNRRVDSNHALVHAAEMANENGLPLLVYEALTCSYKAANDRLHTFVLEAVPKTAKKLKALGAGYFFDLRARRSDPGDLLHMLATHAFAVITDDYPVFITPEKIDVAYSAIDSSCIVPMSRHEKRAYAAYAIRPKIRRELPQWLKPVILPKLKRGWDDNLLSADLRRLRTRVNEPEIASLVANCEIDHTVPPVPDCKGRYSEARKRLGRFLKTRLHRYAKESNQPSRHATSELSPYFHFGQISSLEVALAVTDYAEEHRLIADEFLEELIVRRELAFNFARFTPNPGSLDALPDWCKRTMAKHSGDPRPFLYTPEQFERAETHDVLWNACQKELLIRGTIHGYYRMYWGKKIIEWSPSYVDALREMIRLHDTYALDGCDPNTYANILWCFGLHDRPWGERPVFGQLRYMSIEGMRRKTDTVAYMKEIEGLA